MSIRSLTDTVDPLLVLRDAVAKAPSQQAWADAHDIGRENISRMLNGHMRIGPRVLNALGLEREYVYRRKSHA